MQRNLIYILFTFALFTSSLTIAQWPTTADSALFVDYGLYPYLAVDEQDESITVVYLGAGNKIQAKKYDRYGYPLWGGNAVTLSDTAWGWLITQYAYPTGQWGAVVSDDSGGAIVAWGDYRNADIVWQNGEPVPQNNEIYIQRVDVNGQIRYGANGKRISGPPTVGFYNLGDMKKDHHGGFVVGFNNDSSSATSKLIRYDISGALLWEKYFTGSYFDVNAVDQQGNIFVSAIATQPGKRYKLNLNGNHLWPDTLDGIIPDSRQYRHGGAFSDGMGGVIGVGPGYLRINRADSVGEFVFGENGIDLGGGQQVEIGYAPDLTGGIYASSMNNGVKIHRINSNGNIVFDSSGISPCINTDCGGYNFMVPDQNYGIITIFVTSMNPPLKSYYTQRIDSSGNRLWDSTAVEFYSTPGDPHFFAWRAIASDERGGAIFAWNENGIRMKQISKNGILGEITTTIEKKTALKVIENFQLYQNYPNPFNPSTSIKFQLSYKGKAELKIYNLLGQQITELLSESLLPGKYRIEWNGTDDSGRKVASGIYYYSLKVDGNTQIRKMILLR